MLNIMIVLVDCNTTLLIFDYSESQEFLLNTLQSRKCWREVSWHKSRLLKKIHLRFLMQWIKSLTNQEVGWGVVFAGCIYWLRSVVVVVFCKKLPQL